MAAGCRVEAACAARQARLTSAQRLAPLRPSVPRIHSYGTAQDFELHREWVFDLEFPGQSKLREDGLSKCGAALVVGWRCPL